MSAFATTRWSLIHAAAGKGEPGRDALTELCRIYREPMRRYLARYAVPGLETEDLLQGFLLSLIESGLLGRALPEKGSFRAYLIASMRRFVARQLETQRASKRGGDAMPADADIDALADGDPSPEELFDCAWAEVVLDRALHCLRDEARARGRGDLFDRLAPFLGEDAGRGEYARLAVEVGMRPNAIAAAVLRLRERFRSLVRAEVTQTVSSPQALESEMDCLRRRLLGD